jgi:hypothetical protein
MRLARQNELSMPLNPEPIKMIISSVKYCQGINIGGSPLPNERFLLHEIPLKSDVRQCPMQILDKESGQRLGSYEIRT